MDILEIIKLIQKMTNQQTTRICPEYAIGALQGYLAAALNILEQSNPNEYDKLINLIQKEGEIQ